jgi:hypothetical protein
VSKFELSTKNQLDILLALSTCIDYWSSEDVVPDLLLQNIVQTQEAFRLQVPENVSNRRDIDLHLSTDVEECIASDLVRFKENVEEYIRSQG